MKKILFSLLILAASFGLKAQTSGKAYVEIQTSAVCGTCKAIIEKAIEGVDGVKLADLDLETSVVSVKYDAEKTNPEAIRTIIIQSGYAADTLPANKEAYEKLPACCKSDTHE